MSFLLAHTNHQQDNELIGWEILFRRLIRVLFLRPDYKRIAELEKTGEREGWLFNRDPIPVIDAVPIKRSTLESRNQSRSKVPYNDLFIGPESISYKTHYSKTLLDRLVPALIEGTPSVIGTGSRLGAYENIRPISAGYPHQLLYPISEEVLKVDNGGRAVLHLKASEEFNKEIFKRDQQIYDLLATTADQQKQIEEIKQIEPNRNDRKTDPSSIGGSRRTRRDKRTTAPTSTTTRSTKQSSIRKSQDRSLPA